MGLKQIMFVYEKFNQIYLNFLFVRWFLIEILKDKLMSAEFSQSPIFDFGHAIKKMSFKLIFKHKLKWKWVFKLIEICVQKLNMRPCVF